jgi:SAM-dependent methyltransferase
MGLNRTIPDTDPLLDARGSLDGAHVSPLGSEGLYKNGRYLELNPTWHVEHSPWKAKQIFKIIQRNRLYPNSICEVGCGAGEVLNQLHLLMPQNCSFTGYEISPQAFQLCEKREKERLHFQLKNPLCDGGAYFDIVLAIDVFEHVEDYLGFLRQLRKTGQYKIFHVPLDLSIQAVFRGSPILQVRRTFGHIHYFTKDTALATLMDTGYEILDCFYTPYSLDLPAQSFKGVLAKCVRKMFYEFDADMTVRVFGGFSLMILTR